MQFLSQIMQLAKAEVTSWHASLESLIVAGVPTNADTATFSGAMKTRFIGPIRDTMHKGRVLLWGSGGDTGAGTPDGFKGILPSAEDISFVGNEFRIPFKTKRNQAVGFRSENELIMAPGASGYTYLTEPLRYAYGIFNVTGQLMEAAEVGEGAFKAAFRSEMDDTVLTSQLDFNRAAWGDGSGKMATVRTTTAAAATVVPVDTTINFRGGEIIDFVDASGVVQAGQGGYTVIGVDRTNRQLTVSPALAGTGVTLNVNFLVRASIDSTVAAPNNSFNKEIQGVQSIVTDTGSLHGVNPATVPFWKSYVKNIGGAVSDAVIRDALDGVGFEAGVDMENDLDYALISTRGIRRRYADTLLGVKQFVNVESQNLRGGFKYLDFDGNPWFCDDACPIGTVVGLSLKDFFWAQSKDWDWMDRGEGVLKWETRRDRYVAVLRKYCQLGTGARNRHFRITGITDDVR
jgi:hypothetical protein